jgi:MraZ protein
MLLGQVRSNLGDNHALVIPASFREGFKQGGIITRGFDRNLLLVSNASFEVISNQAGSLNLTDPMARMLRRLILGNATRVEMDNDGSMALPVDLLDSAGIKGELILVGQGDYCEVWSPDEWANQVNDLLDASANKNRFTGLNLCLRQNS